MTKSQIKAAIEITAKEEGKTELEIISQAQAGAAAKGDEESLEILCDLKWEYII
jgi:hypothetical protein